MTEIDNWHYQLLLTKVHLRDIYYSDKFSRDELRQAVKKELDRIKELTSIYPKSSE